VIVEIFRKEIDNDHHNNERTKLYKWEILIALKKPWPGLFDTDIARVSQKDCIENGVEIPTASRWLGHQDGGALCMKTYGHLPDEHSANQARKVAF